MLTFKRRKITVPFLASSVETTEHYTEIGGREYALRKVDDLFFLYVDGVPTTGRLYFDTLKAGKAAMQRLADRGA